MNQLLNMEFQVVSVRIKSTCGKLLLLDIGLLQLLRPVLRAHQRVQVGVGGRGHGSVGQCLATLSFKKFIVGKLNWKGGLNLHLCSFLNLLVW